MGRTMGFVLAAAGLVAGIIVGVLMFTYRREGSLSSGAAILGFALFTAVIVLPLLGGGVYLLVRGGQEAAQMAEVKQQRKLLSVVKTQGQINIADLAVELKSSREQVQNMVYDLVGRGLYTGYINWDEGVLYSQQASQLRDLHQCKHCGGQLQLAGKGVIRCPFCDTEYFL